MRMRILGHRIVVLLGIMLLMVLGCQTPPGPLLEGEGTSLDSPAAARHPLMEGEACRTLVLVDSLMWQQPDSAFALLQAFAVSPEADSLDVFEGHYCQLLVAELLYKNYCEQSNRTELLKAVGYFDSIADLHGAGARGVSVWPFQRRDASHASAKTKAFLAARAHYINGVGYYERDSVVEACREYLKALETMEECFEEKSLTGKKARFMANLNNRLGDLFSEQFLMESSIDCYQRALVYCMVEPTSPNGVANILYRIGKQYDKKDEEDKAREYYQRALDSVRNTDNIVYRDIVSSKALCDYNTGMAADSAIKEISLVLLQADTEYERLNRCLTIGGILYYENNYNAAACYYTSVFESEEIGLKVQAAHYLQLICAAKEDMELADSLVQFQARYVKSEGENKALVAKLEGSYQDYLNRRLEKQSAIEREKATTKVVVVLLLFSLFVSLAIIVLAKHRGYELLRQQKSSAEALLEEKDRRLEMEKKAHQREKKKLQQGLQQRENQVSELKKALGRQCSETEQRREAFMKEEICRRINDCVRGLDITARNSHKKTVPFTEEDAAALKAAVSRHYENFETILLSRYPKMRNEDLQLCEFYLLGLNECQIASIQCKSYSAIKKRVETLKRLLQIEEDLPDYLLKTSSFIEAESQGV